MNWQIKQIAKVKMKDPILIEGLPGMGNVGKIAVDFLIDSLKAKKLYEITSYQLPHCVFVNEENLVELPEIEIYYKNIGGRTLLFLAGDIQPLNEQSCYEFCHTLLDTVKENNVDEIVTLGGIALPKIPKSPKVYCTGNSKKLIQRYEKSRMVNTNIHGVVGPIIGVSGLLTGLAQRWKIPAIALLAETFGHPNYLGVTGAKQILKILGKRLNLKVDVDLLERQFEEMRSDIQNLAERRSRDLPRVLRKADLPDKDVDYIG
ncbi:MAG: PAC2 family protein [Nanoarchaeota archaeon]